LTYLQEYVESNSGEDGYELDVDDFVMLYADLFQADEGTDENLRCVFEICTLRLQLMKVYLVEKYCVTKCDDFYDSIDDDDDKDSIDNDDEGQYRQRR
jgi:hypothetical protein